MSFEIKQNIIKSLNSFNNDNLFDSSILLFKTLGYNVERQYKIHPSNFQSFHEQFVIGNTSGFNEEKAKVKNWIEVDLLFQLTKVELINQGILFDTKKIDRKIIESYLFFAIELKSYQYTRSIFSEITREVNKLFSMPVLLLFKVEKNLTLAIIDRRINEKNINKDVLEKITLIKDINIQAPHRGHIEILFDLSFGELYKKYEFDSFIALHNAWQKALDVNELNKRFYQELANWYFWAIENVEFPDDIKFHKEKVKDRQIRHSTNVIRLITRLIFTWFLKEKNLVPPDLFEETKLKHIINKKDSTGSTYYKSILQNLFFATLNNPMNADIPGSRTFVKDQHMIHSFYRYERFFTNKMKALDLFENIPFLNGGLFECLDKKDNDGRIIRIDCFSDNPKNENKLKVPDKLFFSDLQEFDLNATYQTKNKKYKVRGIINILSAYKFTVHENTPIEEEVALDPELLGKVFENLLASYNPETESTARKLTGSFYTPRTVVNYMVDESLLFYLTNYLHDKHLDFDREIIQTNIKLLLEYTEVQTELTETQQKLLVEAIFHIKIIDPACGSGAFPMGALHKLVYILSKIDKENKYWRELQKLKAIKETESAYNLGNQQDREDRLKDISETFENNNNDYGRKLYLIENSIYGIDKQPIAVQIAKLRFFISLIVDQKIEYSMVNLGVRPLPNLETKFVAADSLIGIERPSQQILRNPLIDIKEAELKLVREKHFTARTSKTKEKYRTLDAKLRKEIADLLKADGFGSITTEMLANWNPYDQNSTAEFFDTEWMFNLTDGFDIIIGNPPFISYYARRSAKLATSTLRYYQNNYKFITDKKLDGKFNSIMFFIEKGLKLGNKTSSLFFILDVAFNDVPYRYIRKYLLYNSKILKIVTGLSEFENVYSDQLIIQVTKNKNELLKDIEIKYFSELSSSPTKLINQDNLKKNKLFEFKPPLEGNVESIFTRMEKNPQLADLFPAKLIRTCMSLAGHEDEFLAINTKNIGDKPVLNYIQNAKNLPDRYSTLINPDKVVFNESLKDKLNKFYRNDAYNEIRRQPKALGLGSLYSYLNPKIFVRQSGDKIIATYTESACAANTSFYIINSNDEEGNYSKVGLKYLLGILNSKILTFYALSKDIIITGKKKQPQMMIKPFKTLPIAFSPFINNENINILEIVVDYIITLKLNNIDSSFFESLANSLVYELYLEDIIKRGGCELFIHLGNLQPLNYNWSKHQKLNYIENVKSNFIDETHPVRKAMYFMNTIEEVALIEGKMNPYFEKIN